MAKRKSAAIGNPYFARPEQLNAMDFQFMLHLAMEWTARHSRDLAWSDLDHITADVHRRKMCDSV